ncbi:hypothetical protein PHMEG_00013964 [Phytophthora megakarya]|uniref:Uncharacterized protein n=1 Tax=Phytophthora megakarya TaxID=4795 RepID=A0A225W5G6_9STRA|nr:hypothetical protein PHMEG_00013964 [Phytophthora megakarya]
MARVSKYSPTTRLANGSCNIPACRDDSHVGWTSSQISTSSCITLSLKTGLPTHFRVYRRLPLSRGIKLSGRVYAQVLVCNVRNSTRVQYSTISDA